VISISSAIKTGEIAQLRRNDFCLTMAWWEGAFSNDGAHGLEEEIARLCDATADHHSTWRDDQSRE
jgi:hypothetical protein